MLRTQNKRLLIFATLAAALTTACATDFETVESTKQALSPDQRYIVQFNNTNGRLALEAASMQIVRELPDFSAAAAYIPDSLVDALRNNPNILSVEVDQRRYALAQNTPYGIDMVQASDPALPDGSSTANIKVCIIDSGIRGGHEDFAGINVNGNNLAGTGNWNADLCGHGTHVAGTIAAADNSLGVIGVAPNAVDLHIVKVFSGTGCGWTYASTLASALNECTSNGANVVSMSLGGSGSSSAEGAAFQNAYDSGVLSIAAAGNGGNTQHSYPASYDAVVSVAAVDSAEAKADFSQSNNQVEIAAPGVGVLSTYNVRNIASGATGDRLANQIEFSNATVASGALVNGGLCDSVGSWGGNVVLCERGVISFNDKVQNVQAGGGAGAILYNNAAGNFNGTLGAGNTSVIPALSVSQADGQAMLTSDLGSNCTVESGQDGDGYAELDGTSMATPHVSAVAARIWAEHPTKSAAEVRAALQQSARDLGAAGRDNDFGYGLIQAKDALDALANGPQCTPDGSACDSSNDTCCDGFSCQRKKGQWTCRTDDGGGEPPVCTPAGDSCKKAADCCSGVCNGSGRSKSCG